MLKIFRGMKADPSGLPLCGDTARSLGVRVPIDIATDADGLVHPGTGGMSTAPDDPLLLPPHRRPRSLLGTGPDPVFGLPVGDIGQALQTRQDTPRHAFVEPADSMELPFYVHALQATRPRWKKVA